MQDCARVKRGKVRAATRGKESERKGYEGAEKKREGGYEGYTER